jgi:hypothetical protein
MENTTLENAALAALSSAAVMASFTVGATDASATTEVPRGADVLHTTVQRPGTDARMWQSATPIDENTVSTGPSSPGGVRIGTIRIV